MQFKHILVTGGAGFIGSHLVDALLPLGYKVLCIDNFNDFYAAHLKMENIKEQRGSPAYRLVTCDIRNKALVRGVVQEWQPDVIVHLAAQAGVGPSISEPEIYQDINLTGTLNMLEVAKDSRVRKFIFGSSSSVYGLNSKLPFAETDSLLKPASPYAATKIAGEALCHTYAHIYGIEAIVLRFFTVYGPRQRPDLAIRKFAEKMLQNEEITLFGDGNSARDYTYIADIVCGIMAAITRQGSGYDVFNLGNSSPVKLIELVHLLENVLETEARIVWAAEQAGDVPITYADITKAKERLGYVPKTPLEVGLNLFADWLRRRTIF